MQNKDAALDIDHTCHNIHNNTADIQLYGGIERQNGALGDTVTWERRSDKNVLDAQKTRAKSEKLRAEVEHGLATAASTMLNAWNNSNQSFTSRIEESSEAHGKIQSQLSLTMQEMYDLGRHIANIKLAIKSKQAPLKVAQTRLELRSHRPNGEATKDTPQVRLTQEVTELQASLSKLNSKLADAEAAMKMLKNTKRELKDDLHIKALSLVIDRQKCMAIRLNFPYHIKCVCSTAKEDEAQDLSLYGNDFDLTVEDAPSKVRILKKKGIKRGPKARPTYYMKF